MPFWPPKWHPRGEGKLGLGLLGPIQDGFEIVLVQSFFRLVVRDRFFGRFGVVFGRSGGRFGDFSAVQLIDSTRQLIN